MTDTFGKYNYGELLLEFGDRNILPLKINARYPSLGNKKPSSEE